MNTCLRPPPYDESIYGFGVEGMAQASRGLPTSHEVVDRGSSNITYHYFRGLGARTSIDSTRSVTQPRRVRTRVSFRLSHSIDV